MKALILAILDELERVDKQRQTQEDKEMKRNSNYHVESVNTPEDLKTI